MDSHKLYCVVTAHSKHQDPEDIVKVLSLKSFARYTTSERGRKVIREHSAVSFMDKSDALKEAKRRIDTLAIKEAMEVTRMDFANSIHTQRFSIPASVIALLDTRIKELNSILETNLKTSPNNSGFYLTAISALTELKETLEGGTVADFTNAVMKMYSFRSAVYMEVPNDVVKFLHTGGVMKLQHYLDLQKPV